MITVLPPDLREQLRYSKLNVRLLRYILVTGLLIVALIVISYFNNRYALEQKQVLNNALNAKRQQTAAYTNTKKSVDIFKSKLKTVQTLLATRTRFSVLLSDIANVLPNGTYITSIVLTGDDKKPLQVLVNVDSFDKGAVIRNALSQSDRIKSVDIQTITQSTEDSTYIVDLVIAFNEGQAR